MFPARYTGSSKTIEHVFDNLGRETQEVWKTGGTAVRTMDFAYDANGQLTSANDSDPGARDFVFEHDNLGRAKETEWSAAGRLYTMTNTYDAGSRRTERNIGYDPGAPYYPAPNWLIDSWQYDNLDRVKTATQGGHYSILPKRAEFAYNADSQLAEIKRFNAATGGTAFVDSDYGYDNAGRLTSLAHKNAAGTTTYVGYGYTFDRGDRITAVDFSSSVISGINAEDVNYAYDRTDQLTGADRSVTDETYAYDESGNRAMTGWVTGANNRLLEDPTFTYTYDEEGNRTSRVRKSGASANDKTTEYSWDHRNRLTQVLHKNNAGTVTLRVQYHYDMFDRMVERVHDPDGDTGSQQVVNEYFLHDGNQRIMHMLTGYAESHIYMFNPVNNELLFDQTGVNYATLTDHLGTVRDFVNPSGQVVNHTIYDAYGNRLSETNPQGGAVPHRAQYGFTGEYFDLATGLNYHHHRWYDPAAGRWISEDPIGFRGGDGNLSRYASNFVSGAIDASGLAAKIIPTPAARIKLCEEECARLGMVSAGPITTRYDYSWCGGRIRFGTQTTDCRCRPKPEDSGKCTDQQLAYLQTAKDVACLGAGKPRPNMSCDKLIALWQANTLCAAARERIQTKCFPGKTNKVHQDLIKQHTQWAADAAKFYGDKCGPPTFQNVF